MAEQKNLNDGNCPKCGASNPVGGNIDIEGDNAVRQNMGCDQCDHTWVNSYTLTNQF